MSTSETVYVLVATNGEHELRTQWICGVFTDLQTAGAALAECHNEEWHPEYDVIPVPLNRLSRYEE